MSYFSKIKTKKTKKYKKNKRGKKNRQTKKLLIRGGANINIDKINLINGLIDPPTFNVIIDDCKYYFSFMNTGYDYIVIKIDNNNYIIKLKEDSDNKEDEISLAYWNCPCVPMRERKECHCMLFLTPENEFSSTCQTFTN